MPSPGCPSQSSWFFRVWLPSELPLRADRPAYFGLTTTCVSQPFRPCTKLRYHPSCPCQCPPAVQMPKQETYRSAMYYIFLRDPSLLHQRRGKSANPLDSRESPPRNRVPSVTHCGDSSSLVPEKYATNSCERNVIGVRAIRAHARCSSRDRMSPRSNRNLPHAARRSRRGTACNGTKANANIPRRYKSRFPGRRSRR
jgi:hypothetical protein